MRYKRYTAPLVVWLLLLLGSVPAGAISRLDSSFGLNGRVAVELGTKTSGHAVLVQPDGRILVGGASSTGTGSDFSLLRFNKNGSLDTTFNGEGARTASVARGDDEILALGLLADGRIVAGGYSHNGTDRDFALACFLPDGALDRRFGTNGVLILPVGSGNEEITALTIGRDDMITVAGAVEGTAGRVLATARFFPDGALDPGYGEQGVSLIAVGKDVAAEGLIGRADGTLVVSGSYTDGKTASLVLVGLTADGVLDVGFGEQGVAVPAERFAASEGYRLAEDQLGRIYLAGSVGQAGQRDTALFRFSASGKADVSFGKGGVMVSAVSREDDVLYDVVVARRGVVASGYTTDGGTRQFLLATFRDNGSEPLIETTGDVQSHAETLEEPSSSGDIQEVRQIRGKTLQIRKLKIAPSRIDASSAVLAPADPRPVALTDAAEPVAHDALGRLVRVAMEGVGVLLATPAMAAASGSTIAGAESDAGMGAVRFVTTTFSSGASVSYALTTDAAGNVIAVGTADGTDSSSMVAARYVADATTSTSDAGYTNGNVLTRTPTDITRASVITGGEIKPGLGKAVTKRGVVFSTIDTPIYTGSGGSSGDDSSDDNTDGTTGSGPTVTVTSPADGATLPANTTITLAVATNVTATCAYSTRDVPYASMTAFNSTNATTHETGLSLNAGQYTYYVRCSSSSAGTNGSSVSVRFTVGATTGFLPLNTFEVLSGLLSPTSALAATTTTATSTTGSSSTTGSNSTSSGSIFAVNTSEEDDTMEHGFVKQGETENGSGYGAFSVQLKKLKPGTTYYVRAYAVTADGVYYGPQMQFRTADACFVATASYGNLLHPGVRILRQFRDVVLLDSVLGQALVDLYYTFSPPVADRIAASTLLRHLVQLLLLPLIGFSWLAIQLGMTKALLVALATGWLGWCGARGFPGRRLWQAGGH